MDRGSPILLSICIPTYNRSSFLKRTIESIITQESFNEEVEIVISDNSSTDSTNEKVAEYLNKYRNIRYNFNDINIEDENFNKVLSLGSGEYLKLMNDTSILQPGALTKMILNIKKFRELKPPLFFYNNNERRSDCIIQCNDLNEFVNTTSYYVGWIANFGAWKIQFDNLENKSRIAFLKFLQVDWSFRIIEGMNSVVVFGNWINMQQTDSKGGYNIFEVHIDNYLFIFQPYVNNGRLKSSILKREKNRLLWYFISDWVYLTLFRKDPKYKYKTTGWRKIFWRHYKYNPLLILVFSKQILKYIIYRNEKVA